MIHCDAAAHLRLDHCVEQIQRRAWWLNWRGDTILFLKCCKKCNAYHRGAAPKQGKLRPMVLGSPNERYCLDLTGPHPRSNGFVYIFTAIDPFTKFAVAVPIRNKEAKTVAKVFMEHVLLKFGLCNEVLTDLDPEFEAELVHELCRLLGINKLKTSGYRASCNGCIEKWHRVLNTLLAKVISDHQKDWSEFVS
jgi:transposase InsO family protein